MTYQEALERLKNNTAPQYLTEELALLQEAVSLAEVALRFAESNAISVAMLWEELKHQETKKG